MKNKLEHARQVEIFDLFEGALLFGAFMFAIPNQSNRHINNAVKMKREGVRAGVPDICVMMMHGEVIWLETKTDKGVLSEAQKRFQARAEHLEHSYYVIRNIADAAGALYRCGAISQTKFCECLLIHSERTSAASAKGALENLQRRQKAAAGPNPSGKRTARGQRADAPIQKVVAAKVRRTFRTRAKRKSDL